MIQTSQAPQRAVRCEASDPKLARGPMPEAEQSYLPENNDAASRPRGWPAIALPGVVPKAASDRLASSDFHAKFARPLYARRAGRVLPHPLGITAAELKATAAAIKQTTNK